MKWEYELHTSIKNKRNMVDWMSGLLIMGIYGLELLNDHTNPYDLKFNGAWTESVTNNKENYNDILADIYEKYSTPGKTMAPELRLVFALTQSALTIQVQRSAANFTLNKCKSSENLDNDPSKFEQYRKKHRKRERKSKRKRERTKVNKSSRRT